MAGRFSVEAVFKAVDRMTAPISRMQNRVGRFTRAMGSQFDRLNRNVDRFSSGLKRSALAVTAGLAISTGAMANVVSTGADFQQTLVSAAAKFPGEIRRGTVAYKQLEDAARNIGATTEFTASQAAEALNFLAMAGFDSAASITALPGVVDLATAAQVDLATATDIASDTLGAFGLATKNATQLGVNLARVNDVIAKTTTTSNTTVEKLFETMRKAGPVATAAGASLETVAAMAGVMANAGIKAELAGTAIANSFLNLSNPASTATKVMRRLGIQTRDAAGNLLDMPDIVDNIRGATEKLTKAQRLAVIESIFGREGLAGTANVIASGGDALREYRKQLEGATGASTTMATVMRDTVQGRINSLSSAIEGVKISLFTMTEGPLADAIDSMTKWVRANQDVIASGISEFLVKLIDNAGLFVDTLLKIGAGIAAVMALSLALKAVSVVLGIINLIMAANPLVIAIMAAVAAVALLSGALDPVLKVVKAIGSGIAQAFEAGGRIADFFGFGGNENNKQTNVDTTGPQIISPQDRVAKRIDEQRTSSTAEVTIRDETGRAQVTSGKLGPGLTLANSGGF